MEEHPEARLIVETLAKEGFIAYYAGGWVRDFLLGRASDDIDIATNAPPETIQALFPRTVPIGIAFGIILVIIDERQYEVATFRQDLDYKDGRRPSRVEFSTPAQDAKRRDFTINGMFYDPLKKEVLDFVEGKVDLQKKIIRAIGNPHERIKEDRLRMIRAIRLSCRFNFTIEPATASAIRAHANELFPAVAIERVWQEFTKGHAFGNLGKMLFKLFDFDLLGVIFPELKELSSKEIDRRLTPLKHYPPEAPAIASVLALFPNAPLEEWLALCKRFKLSLNEQEFTRFLFNARLLIKHTQTLPIEPVEWAYFYANERSAISLNILAASLEPAQQSPFLQSHEKRRKELANAISRIQQRNPVVKSEDLLAKGIQPGKTMGQLLKEAERLAINQYIEQPEQIIEELKKTDLWPK